MEYTAGEYDVIVIGAGHAGCESALLRLEWVTKHFLLTINLDMVAYAV